MTAPNRKSARVILGDDSSRGETTEDDPLLRRGLPAGCGASGAGSSAQHHGLGWGCAALPASGTCNRNVQLVGLLGPFGLRQPTFR